MFIQGVPSFFGDQDKDYIIEATVYHALTLVSLTETVQDQVAEKQYTIGAACYNFSFSSVDTDQTD